MEEQRNRQIGKSLYLSGLLLGLSIGVLCGGLLPVGVILPTLIMLTVVEFSMLVYQLHLANNIKKQLRYDSNETIMLDSTVAEDPLLEWQQRFDESIPETVEETDPAGIR